MQNKTPTSETECISAVEQHTLIQAGAIEKRGAWYQVLDWDKLSLRARECIGEINTRNGLRIKFRR